VPSTSRRRAKSTADRHMSDGSRAAAPVSDDFAVLPLAGKAAAKEQSHHRRTCNPPQMPSFICTIGGALTGDTDECAILNQCDG